MTLKKNKSKSYKYGDVSLADLRELGKSCSKLLGKKHSKGFAYGRKFKGIKDNEHYSTN